MHKLNELLKDGVVFFDRDSYLKADTIITTYLKGRCEWLKTESRVCDVRRDHFPLLNSLTECAFELDEKCEHYCACGEKLQDNGKCPLEPRDEPKPLPSKFGYSDKENSLTNELCKAINQLIDYLHTKEAR